jgi:Mycothiol maleylpyruvate isomerase N-terminal domain
MTIERGPEHIQALADDLVAARQAFNEALADVDPALLTAPGLVGEWSARELIAHLAYWAGHAAEALHQAEQGRVQDFGEDEMDVDARNAVVARVAAETDLATVRQREEAAFDALLARLKRAEPDALEEHVSYGDSLEHVVRDDGADHYREHTADLRSWFTRSDEPSPDEE